MISDDGSETGSQVEIVDSGTIQVTEGVNDEGEEEDDGGNEEEGQGNLYNTDNEPYRITLSDDESITISS